jgi:hypothetical protein
LGSDAWGQDGPIELGEVRTGLSDRGADHDSDRTETGSWLEIVAVTGCGLIHNQLADRTPIRSASMLDLRTFGIAGQGQDVDPTTSAIG